MSFPELEREVRAQIALARASGLTLTHLDGHQHLLQLRSAEPFYQRWLAG